MIRALPGIPRVESYTELTLKIRHATSLWTTNSETLYSRKHKAEPLVFVLTLGRETCMKTSKLAILLCSSILFAQSGAISAQIRTGALAKRELKGKVGTHTYRVVLQARDAKGDGRKITFQRASDPAIASDGISINGARTYGFDGISHYMAPKGRSATRVLEENASEIHRFNVWLDGKPIKISRRKHETMLMPDLKSAKAELSKDGKTLTLIMSGSDGAGFWTAVWTVRRSGKVDVSIGTGG